MVAKLIVLYTNIKDAEKFDDYYRNVHVPLAKKIPGVRKIVISKVKSVAVGKSDHYQVVEVYFDDMDSLRRAGNSREAKEATDDGLSLDPKLCVLVAEEESM
ncbi:MAG: EthD family reductase [Nitrososphaerales archaeon]